MNFSLQFFILLILFFLLIFNLYNYRKKLNELESARKKDKETFKEQKNKIDKLEADIKTKLQKAKNVHQRMLPDKLDEPDGYFISDYYQPAEYIGGDYYNVFRIDHGSLDPFFDQYLIYFFDVSGHGIDSTLLSIFVNDSIENYFKLRHNPGEKISTSKLMNYIDQRYQKEGFPDDYLVCLFIAVLDKKKNTLSYSSGGFQYPIYKLDNSDQLEEINIGGLPISTALGALTDSREEYSLSFEQNNTLILSTDGLLEQSNGSVLYFEQLQSVLKEYKFLPAPFLKDLICSDFYDFTNNNPGEDDITFLIVERPGGDSLNFSIEQKNNELKQSKIFNFLDNKAKLGSESLKSAKKIIGDLIKNQQNSFQIKAINDQRFLMFSIEDQNNILNWESFFADYPFLTSIAKKRMDLLKDDSSEISFNNGEIYGSYNSSNNKGYLMIIKENNK